MPNRWMIPKTTTAERCCARLPNPSNSHSKEDLRAPPLASPLVLGRLRHHRRAAGDRPGRLAEDLRLDRSPDRLVVGCSASTCRPIRPSVEQIQSLAELVTLRVQVIDILTVEQDGWLQGYKGAWLIRGDALWTTDLRHARIQMLPNAGLPIACIELPSPTVTWARLDHSKTRTYDLRSKSWIPLVRVPEHVYDEALQRAQELVARTAARSEYRQQAQRQAESVLQRFYADAGFAVEVVWVELTAP